MRLLLTADWHIHPHRVGSRNGGIDRLDDGINALVESFKLANHLHAVWVGLGDFKMPRTSWPQDALIRTLDAFRAANYIEKYMIAGNHDWKSAHGTGLAPFRDVSATTRVIETPELVSLGDHVVAMWPYWILESDASQRRDWTAALEDAQHEEATVLLSHGFMAGVILGPDDARLPGKGLKLADVGSPNPFKLVCLGDIHQAQMLSGKPAKWRKIDGSAFEVRSKGKWSGEIIYPGSPYAQNWGERNTQKGALLVDLDSGEITFHTLPGPRFLLVDWTGREEAGCWRDDVVRLRTDRAMTSKEAETIREHSGARILEVIYEKKSIAKSRTELHAGMSVDEILTVYVKARPAEGLPSTKLLKAGKDLLHGRA
jgi:DNA repair exonuclease SbcCD nuclease subunit